LLRAGEVEARRERAAREAAEARLAAVEARLAELEHRINGHTPPPAH
jgi:transcription elongation GreA/GreB family factor